MRQKQLLSFWRPFMMLGAIVALLFAFGARRSVAKCGGEGHGPSYTTAGTEFLLVFMENVDATTQPNQYCDIYLASLSDSATVTISSRANGGFQHVVTLSPKASTTFRISDFMGNPDVNGSEQVSPLAIVVNSTAPIICYGMNHAEYSADAFAALPIDAVGQEYRILAYTNSYFSNIEPEVSEFAVAAFHDGTHIQITPADRTFGGATKGNTFSITLDSGECYQVQADPSLSAGDLTGSIVSADQPIAVFGGHERAEVPYGYALPDVPSTTSRDHLCEQLPPVTAWGSNFVTTRISELDQPDLLRVLALNDNTTIRVNGQLWKTLGADGYADTLISGPVSIETSGPCLVGQYAHTTKTQEGLGDPFFAIVPPVDQVYNDFTFFLSDNSAYTEHHIMLAVDSAAMSTVYLDGSRLTPSYSMVQTGGKTFGVATVDVTPGSHRLETGVDETKGAILIGYGYGPADSYGYSAGSLIKPLHGITMRVVNVPSAISGQQDVVLKNCLPDIVYLDSVQFLINGVPTDQVKFHERVWQDVGRIPVNDDVVLSVDASKLQRAAMCTVRVFHHVYTHSICDVSTFAPAELTFAVHPEPAADVTTSAQAQHIEVYPNPVLDVLKVHAPDDFNSYTLFNALGQEVKSGSVQGPDFGINVHELSAGTYWLELAGNGLQRSHLRITKR